MLMLLRPHAPAAAAAAAAAVPPPAPPFPPPLKRCMSIAWVILHVFIYLCQRCASIPSISMYAWTKSFGLNWVFDIAFKLAIFSNYSRNLLTPSIQHKLQFIHTHQPKHHPSQLISKPIIPLQSYLKPWQTNDRSPHINTNQKTNGVSLL